MLWLDELTVRVCGDFQVVGAGTNTRVGEDIVDAAVGILCSFEKSREIGPASNIGLDEQRSGFRRRVDISTDNCCSK